VSKRHSKEKSTVKQEKTDSDDESTMVEDEPEEDEDKIVKESEADEDEEDEEDEDEDEDDEATHIKAAKQAWKIDNPEGSIKHQRRLLELKLIDDLPWNLPPYSLLAHDDAALEAAKWAQEQIEKSEDSKKKDSDLDGEHRGKAGKEDQRILKGYVQNAEQSSNTLWKKVQDAKGKL
jgi:hypothetical protein